MANLRAVTGGSKVIPSTTRERSVQNDLVSTRVVVVGSEGGRGIENLRHDRRRPRGSIMHAARTPNQQGIEER